jgi:hypothetical protein
MSQPPLNKEQNGLHNPVECSGEYINPVKEWSPLFLFGFTRNLLRHPHSPQFYRAVPR